MNISSAASFIDLFMPNSFACLIEFTVSPPALARPSTLAPLDCACTRKEEKSEVPGNGYGAEPSTLPPAAFTNFVVSACNCLPNA